jgi:hypothetical protein
MQAARTVETQVPLNQWSALREDPIERPSAEESGRRPDSSTAELGGVGDCAESRGEIR